MNLEQATSNGELFEIVRAVTSAVCGWEAEATDNVAVAPREYLTAMVSVSGPWSGGVAVACSLRLASSLAAKMFACDEGQLTRDDIHDALVELVNQVGGNFKSLIASDDDKRSRLSLPIVVEGRVSMRETTSRRSWFSVEGEELCVTVLEGTGDRE